MVVDSRWNRTKLNIICSLGNQLTALVCNMIIPYLLIRTYGSEAYGASTSIIRFLAYVSLLEGGIGGVARAALYKPLAENNIQKISEIMMEIRRFFRIVAYILLMY